MPIVLTWTVVLAAAVIPHVGLSQQGASGGSAEAALPKDVYPDSRNRLPAIRRDDLEERGKRAYDELFGGARPPRIQGAAPGRLDPERRRSPAPALLSPDGVEEGASRGTDSWRRASTSKHPKRVEGFERALERERVLAAVSLVRSADEAVGEVRLACAVHPRPKNQGRSATRN